MFHSRLAADFLMPPSVASFCSLFPIPPLFCDEFLRWFVQGESLSFRRCLTPHCSRCPVTYPCGQHALLLPVRPFSVPAQIQKWESRSFATSRRSACRCQLCGWKFCSATPQTSRCGSTTCSVACAQRLKSIGFL